MASPLVKSSLARPWPRRKKRWSWIDFAPTVVLDCPARHRYIQGSTSSSTTRP